MAGHFEPYENEKGTMQSGAKFLFFCFHFHLKTLVLIIENSIF